MFVITTAVALVLFHSTLSRSDDLCHDISKPNIISSPVCILNDKIVTTVKGTLCREFDVEILCDTSLIKYELKTHKRERKASETCLSLPDLDEVQYNCASLEKNQGFYRHSMKSDVLIRYNWANGFSEYQGVLKKVDDKRSIILGKGRVFLPQDSYHWSVRSWSECLRLSSSHYYCPKIKRSFIVTERNRFKYDPLSQEREIAISSSGDGLIENCTSSRALRDADTYEDDVDIVLHHLTKQLLSDYEVRRQIIYLSLISNTTDSPLLRGKKLYISHDHQKVCSSNSSDISHLKEALDEISFEVRHTNHIKILTRLVDSQESDSPYLTKTTSKFSEAWFNLFNWILRRALVWIFGMLILVAIIYVTITKVQNVSLERPTSSRTVEGKV